MSRPAATGQRLAVARMTDRCEITRHGAPVFNEATGDYTPAAPTVLYAGQCRVRRENVQEHRVQAGEREFVLHAYIVSVPLSVLGVESGDLVSITASSDADLLGVSLQVKDVGRGTSVVARRLACEEQS